MTTTTTAYPPPPTDKWEACWRVQEVNPDTNEPKWLYQPEYDAIYGPGAYARDKDLIDKGMTLAIIYSDRGHRMSVSDFDNPKVFRHSMESYGRYLKDLDAGSGPEPGHLPGMNALDLMALDIPELQQAVEGLLPEGLGVMGAPPKAGKSLLAYQLAVELVCKGAILGINVERRPVLYYALEDGRRRSQGRVRATALGRTAGLENLELRWAAPKLGGPLEEEINEYLDTHPLGVVIVDVLSKVRTTGKAGLNAYDEDYAAIEGLHKAATAHPGSTILLITHDRKAGSEDWMTRITGTRGVTGAADFIIFIHRKRDEMVGTIHVTGRDIEDNSYKVQFNGFGWTLAPAEAVIATMSETRQAIWNWVKDHGPSWPKDIADGTGIQPGTVRARLQNMIQDEELTHGPEGYKIPAPIGEANEPWPLLN